MSLDLRLLFLIFLFLTAIIFTLRRGLAFGPEDFKLILLDFLMVPLVAGTVATFGFLLTRTDPMPLLREGAYQMSFQQLVSFDDAVPPNLQDNLAVESVERSDTDGDGFREWVVFYKFDVRSGGSPIQAVIYDNDRGSPPVIFPYILRAPNRDYLSEGRISLEFAQIIADQNGANGEDPEEILVKGARELTIFRFNQNSEEWEPPIDDPPRYQPIGFFRGSGGVSFDEESHNVTVFDRDGFERSQLVRRAVFEFKEATNSYFESTVSAKLAEPIMWTIDFFPGPPDDILDTSFPEKIVLAFYASTCDSSEDNRTLCGSKKDSWQPENFLAPDDDPEEDSALREFQRGTSEYFGLTSLRSTQDVLVRELSYYPQLEEVSAQPVYTGAKPQGNCVAVELGGRDAVSEPFPLAFKMRFVNGQWKIEQRVELEKCVVDILQQASKAEFEPTPTPEIIELGPPTRIPAGPPTQTPNLQQR